MDNNKKSDVAYRLGPAHFQFQNGCQFQWNSAVFVQVMVYTFFLWEITQKFFFLAWGFHILATRKNIFCHPGGSQWAPGGLLARFRVKNAYFWTNLPKNEQKVLELPGYGNPMLGKRIFELSPIEKKLVWPYHGYGEHIGFLGPGT